MEMECSLKPLVVHLTIIFSQYVCPYICESLMTYIHIIFDTQACQHIFYTNEQIKLKFSGNVTWDP